MQSKTPNPQVCVSDALRSSLPHSWGPLPRTTTAIKRAPMAGHPTADRHQEMHELQPLKAQGKSSFLPLGGGAKAQVARTPPSLWWVVRLRAIIETLHTTEHKQQQPIVFGGSKKSAIANPTSGYPLPAKGIWAQSAKFQTFQEIKTF